MIMGEKEYPRKVSESFKRVMEQFSDKDKILKYIDELNKDRYLSYGDRLETLDEILTDMGLKFMEKIEVVNKIKDKIED